MTLTEILAWDEAGPVAILMFVAICLVFFSRWVLAQLLEAKNSQIARLESMNDKLTDETAATLKQILDAVRERREANR